MKRSMKHVVSMSLVAIIVVLAGCQNSTGQLFSPSSDIHVAGISPSVVQPTESSSSGESDSDSESGSAAITFPLVKVYFRIMNGVSVFIDQYTIRYYTLDGVPLANGRYDVTGASSMFIQAPEIGSFEDQGGSGDSGSSGSSDSSGGSGASIRAQSEEGGEQQTLPSDVAGYTTIDIYPPAIFTYMTRGNADPSDDISPVIARITIHGRDLNDKEVSMLTQTTLSSTVLTSNDN